MYSCCFFVFFFKSRDETRAGENPYKFFSTPPLSFLIIPLEFLFRTSAEVQSVREPYSSRASHPSSFIFVHLYFDFSHHQRPRLMFEAEPGWASGIHGHHGDPGVVQAGHHVSSRSLILFFAGLILSHSYFLFSVVFQAAGNKHNRGLISFPF